MSCTIINHLPGIANKTYLELGVFDNQNFNAILCKEKFSVDINGNALFTGTTDEYFSNFSSRRYDIIFIDANHDRDYVVRDTNNAIRLANEWVIIHDMIPPSAKYTASSLCGDSYRLLHYLLAKTKFRVFPMNENYGLTLIQMPATEFQLDDESANLSYEEFVRFVAAKKTYSPAEIINILQNNQG